MLSNLDDSELVISTNNLHITTRTVCTNQSYLFSRANSERSNKHYQYNSSSIDSHCNESSDNGQNDSGSVDNNSLSSEHVNGTALSSDQSDNSDRLGGCDRCVAMPLGSYLHSDKGIASRTPVGRMNMGKYLQVSL